MPSQKTLGSKFWMASTSPHGQKPQTRSQKAQKCFCSWKALMPCKPHALFATQTHELLLVGSMAQNQKASQIQF